MKWQTMSGEPLHLIIWGLICHKVKGIGVFYGHSPKDFISLQLRIFFSKMGGGGLRQWPKWPMGSTGPEWGDVPEKMERVEFSH
jgi:hypothetical protein